jgi:cytochrome oxidase Cu insertion factor (SCO1/SenC/PrrC family)
MSKRQTFISILLAATLSLAVVSLTEIVGRAQPRPQSRAAGVVYECPMHPEVTSKKRGRCSKCGMTLQAKKEKTPDTATAVSSLSEKGLELVSTRLRITDAMVLDQNGRRIKFYSDLVKDKTVAINFIFTTCTAICPTLTATFRRVQQELGERAGRDVHLISISVDPTTDVPERLKDYSIRFKAGAGWTFVTGSKSEIDELLRALGASAPNKNDHTPMALIGNERAGYWTRIYGAASPTSLLKTIDEAASKKADTVPSGPSSNGSGSPGHPGANIESQSASARYFPNLVLRTQDDMPVHFYDDLLKGKVVLINFLFTNCQGVCSPMTANLARAQSYLAEHLDKEVVMISISVDPLTDTPEVLRKYAEKFKIKSGWYFLTGEKKNVDWVLYKLGGYVTDKQQHTSVLIIGNDVTGEWMKLNAMASPMDIASVVTKLLASKPDTATP